MQKKSINYFIEGPISPSFIADSIAKHSSKKNIGAHDIFLGQVRNDIINNSEVVAIEYSCQQAMSIDILSETREKMFSKYNLVCLHIYHSMGVVATGEICFFVFVSSKHRKDANDACRELVETIKKEVPIFGKEIFSDDSYVWKENKL